MKKAIKKFMAALLAVAMLCAMAVPAAFADSSTTYTITINDPVGTYEAYQIFSGTLNNEGALGNIVWGTGVTVVGQEALGTASEVAAGLTDSNVSEFANNVGQYLGNPSGTYDGNGHITGLTAGYYLVKNSSVGEHEVYTSFILRVVRDVNVSPKSDKPSMEKKVKDTNDSNGQTTGWQDSADYDIGDDVPFQLTAKISNKFDDYSTYKFVFHDQQSAGLTFNRDSVTVTVGGVALTSDQFTVDTAPADGCTFHVEIPNLKNIPSAAADKIVAVEYTAKLNSDAVIGSAGNPNTAYLEYSNNPYDSNSTTTTPEDKVTVFTFKVVANKVNGRDEELAGAAFALYKKDSSGQWNLVGLNNATESNGVYTIVDPTKTSFSWEGLDDGDYKIVEIITPDGYNTIADQEFTITATHDETSSDPKLTELNGNATTGEISFTANAADGSLTTKVVNNTGATLPSTGGMGTTLFYVVGGGLMVAAAVLLITKKRMENK